MGETYVDVRRGEYHDSVSLMSASLVLAKVPGIAEAQVAMGTPLNLGLLAERGFDVPAGTGAGDLVVAMRVADLPGQRAESVLSLAADRLDEVLRAQAPEAGGDGGAAPAPRTVGGLLTRTPARLALVSVPGEYAFAEAMDAVRAGSSVMVFSDNVPVWQEVALKEEAARRGVLVMGPDCGTAQIDAAGLGFANVVEVGPVSIVAASGTGAQHLMCLLDAAGLGVRHVIGVGGRDLSAEVGGRSTRQALDALAGDYDTRLTVVVSKPPDPDLVARLRQEARDRRQSVLWAPVGPGERDLTAVAEDVLRAFEIPAPDWPQWRPPTPLAATPGRALRGLFCGGTLCTEAATIAGAALPADRFTMTDFGDDAYTRGRAHPMIDPTLRTERFVHDAADPDVGTVLLDVVLGHGSHPDPAADLAPAVAAARANVVVSLTGSNGDPQVRDDQAAALAAAGAHVHLSNAAATRHAISLLT
ncbi:MAG: FdrA family protein [Streptosporangiales bacterium]|nr:FdrA family protein [Streptosporangiales bacterium]